MFVCSASGDGSATPYAAQTPMYGSRTPMYGATGSRTPMYGGAAGSRTPMYGSQTPTHVQEGEAHLPLGVIVFLSAHILVSVNEEFVPDSSQ